MKDTTRQARAAAMVVIAIGETIEEAKDGAPLGPMYAALMGLISYDTFMSVISALQDSGVIRVSNHCAYLQSPNKLSIIKQNAEKLS